jgi:hypothetical protein
MHHPSSPRPLHALSHRQVYDELDLDRDGRVGYTDLVAMMRMTVPS